MPAKSPAAPRRLLAYAVVLFTASCDGCERPTGFEPETHPRVLGVGVSPSSASIPLGSTITLTAMITVADGATDGITWESTDPNIAPVSPNATNPKMATVTGQALGRSTLLAKASFNPAVLGTSSIEVVAPTLASITVTSPLPAMLVGSTMQLTAVARTSAGAIVPGVTFTWAATPLGVASVSSSGLLTGVSPGTVQVTASSGGVTSAPVSITVNPLVTTTVTAWTAANVTPNTFWKSSGRVRDLFAPTPTLVYAVTDAGNIARWNGTGWTNAHVGPAGFRAIHGSGPDDVYAVGDGGIIRCWNGSTWVVIESPTTRDLFSVHITGQSTGYAVGAGGTILRMTNGVWFNQSSPVTVNLNGISGNQASNLLAVGDNGTIIRFNGSNWAPQASGTTAKLTATWVKGVGGQPGAVVVGTNGTILTSANDGALWTAAPSVTTRTLNDVTGDNATGAAVAVGDRGTVVRTSTVSTSGGWTLEVYEYPDDDLTSVAQSGSTTFVGSDGATVTQRGATGGWTLNTSAPTFLGAATMSDGAVHAVGSIAAHARRLSGTWQTQFGAGGASGTFNALFSPGGSTLFGARSNGVFLYNGTTWPLSFAGAATGVQSIGGTSATDVYAGGLGTLVRFDGATWSNVVPNPVAVTENVWSIAGASGAPVFAGGFVPAAGAGAPTAGFILRLASNTWTRMTLPTSNAIFGLSVVDASNAFAVGDAGTILKYNGTTWTSQMSGTTQRLNSVWAASATDAYAVGNGGIVLRFNGTTWTTMSSGTTLDLHTITGVPGAIAIVGGKGGTILTGSPGSSAAAQVKQP